MNDEFQSKEYKRSRAAYVAQCTVEYFSAILVEDAFLAKLLKEVGLNDSTIGIVSTLVTFSNLIQLLTILLMSRMKNVKRTAVLYDTMSILLLGFTYVLPFLPISQTLRTILVFVCIGGGFFFRYIVASLFYAWGNSFVLPTKRGSFSAGKEMISLSTGIAFTLSIGFVIDRYEAAGNLRGSFIFLGIVMLVLEVLNFIFMMMIGNIDRKKTERQRKNFREVMDNTFRNKGFRAILTLQTMYTVAACATGGFLGTYKTGELMFTVGVIQVINMGGSLARFVVSKPFGRYSDKHSFAKGYALGLIIVAASYLCVIFTTPATRWLIVGYTLLHALAMAGINANGSNLTYSYVPADCFVQASAIKASILGVIGFLSSLAASRVLAAIQASGNVVFGIRGIYGQQVLGLFSLIMILCAYVFARKVVYKLEVMKQ